MGAIWQCSRCALRPKSPSSSRYTNLDGGHANRYDRCGIELSSDLEESLVRHTRTTRKLIVYRSRDRTMISEAQLAGTTAVSKPCSVSIIFSETMVLQMYNTRWGKTYCTSPLLITFYLIITIATALPCSREWNHPLGWLSLLFRFSTICRKSWLV